MNKIIHIKILTNKLLILDWLAKSFDGWFNTNIAILGEHLAPKINPIYWHCFKPFWLFHRNLKAIRSGSSIPISLNMPSLLADTAIGCSRKRKSNPNFLLRRSGPASKQEFKEFPWKSDAAFRPRLTLLFLFELTTGWWRKYQILGGCGLVRKNGLTYRFSMPEASDLFYKSWMFRSLLKLRWNEFNWAFATQKIFESKIFAF